MRKYLRTEEVFEGSEEVEERVEKSKGRIAFTSFHYIIGEIVFHSILMIQVSNTLKNSLWEYDTTKLSYDDEIVVVRALSFGELEDIHTLEKNIGKKKIIDTLKKNLHNIDSKSQNFYKMYFKIKDFNNSHTSMYDKLNTPTFSRSFR